MPSLGGSSEGQCQESGHRLPGWWDNLCSTGEGVNCCLLSTQVTSSITPLYHVRNFTISQLRYGMQLLLCQHLNLITFAISCALCSSLAVLQGWRGWEKLAGDVQLEQTVTEHLLWALRGKTPVVKVLELGPSPPALLRALLAPQEPQWEHGDHWRRLPKHSCPC